MVAPNVDDLFGLLVGYEMVSLATRRVPPVTTVCRAHRWLAVPVVAVVALHLVRRPAV